jgi:hypothetical protein
MTFNARATAKTILATFFQLFQALELQTCKVACKKKALEIIT